jgi:hypothetical protein
MNAVRCRAALVGIIALALAPMGAFGDVKVSIMITGDVEEMMEVLQHLQECGLGIAKPDLDPLKLQIHSEVEPSEIAPAGPPTEPAPEAPSAAPTGLALLEPLVSPASVKAGDTITVLVKASDPNGEIDTVGAQLDRDSGVAFDLFDNGSHGDTKAGDGIWTRVTEVPADLAAGAYQITIEAYDAHGDPLEAKDAQGAKTPVTAQVELTLTR